MIKETFLAQLQFIQEAQQRWEEICNEPYYNQAFLIVYRNSNLLSVAAVSGAAARDQRVDDLGSFDPSTSSSLDSSSSESSSDSSADSFFSSASDSSSESDYFSLDSFSSKFDSYNFLRCPFERNIQLYSTVTRPIISPVLIVQRLYASKKQKTTKNHHFIESGNHPQPLHTTTTFTILTISTIPDIPIYFVFTPTIFKSYTSNILLLRTFVIFRVF